MEYWNDGKKERVTKAPHSSGTNKTSIPGGNILKSGQQGVSTGNVPRKPHVIVKDVTMPAICWIIQKPGWIN